MITFTVIGLWLSLIFLYIAWVVREKKRRKELKELTDLVLLNAENVNSLADAVLINAVKINELMKERPVHIDNLGKEAEDGKE